MQRVGQERDCSNLHDGFFIMGVSMLFFSFFSVSRKHLLSWSLDSAVLYRLTNPAE
jgi:hypothetical protein